MLAVNMANCVVMWCFLPLVSPCVQPSCSPSDSPRPLSTAPSRLEVLKRTLTIEVPAGSSQHSPAFSRTFQLGDTIDADAISADLDLGLLTVTLPYMRKSVAVPRRVTVGGADSASQALLSTSAAGASEAAAGEAPVAEAEAGAAAVKEMAGSSKGEWVDVREAAEEEAARRARSPASSDDEDGSIEDCPVDAQP